MFTDGGRVDEDPFGFVGGDELVHGTTKCWTGCFSYLGI